MTKANTQVVAKVAAVVAGLALFATAFAPVASAQSTADMEAQIEALMAQIAALQAQSGGSASASVTFSRDLTIGSSGADVTALQNWLIKGGYAIPAGATGYFGAQTAAAVAKYQAAVGITPAAGYFGPITRAKVNASAGGSTGGDDDDDSDDDDDNTDGELDGGETSLEDLNGNSGEDSEVEEGGTAQVAEFEFDVEDADARIERLDLGFYSDAGASDEEEPWETFESITILNEDGDELASEDVSDEDSWLDEDEEPYIYRFNSLDYVVDEGETGKLIVEVEAANSVDGADSGVEWTVFVVEDGIRAVDGEGIDQYLGELSNTEGDLDESVDFDVVAEGEGEELNISASSEDPDAATLQVEEDDQSDWFTLFAFELEAEENDIELDDVTINLSGSDSDIRSVVNDAMLVIDGEEFDDFDWGTSNALSYGSTTFDIDGDVTIGADETVTVEYMVEFKAQDGNYATSTTISASTTGSLITGEGADDVTADGSAQGDTHTLQVDGINVSPVEDSAVVTNEDTADADYATFEIEVDVEAVGDDAYISQTAATAYTFQIENASTGAVLGTSTATSSIISSSADTDSNSTYRVDEGETESFTFTVTLNPLPANEGASYRLQLLTINFGELASDPDASTWTATPASDYETNGVLIND